MRTPLLALGCALSYADVSIVRLRAWVERRELHWNRLEPASLGLGMSLCCLILEITSVTFSKTFTAVTRSG